MRHEPAEVSRLAMLHLLHLCDSLFPIGGFAHSDGLETATFGLKADPLYASGGPTIAGVDDLCGWLDVYLDETIGRLEGPAVWRAFAAVRDGRSEIIATIDEELTALRPSSNARRASHAMGLRLLTTWHTLYADARLAHLMALARAASIGPTLPVAFAAACACGGIDRRQSVEAFAYTRLAATVSAAMRLMPIGQSDAHGLLARTLDRVPSVVDGVIDRDDLCESFTPAMDIAVMSQQYLHSRLFRS